MGWAARRNQERSVKPEGWNPTAIIQARMGSSRLPGKTLMLIDGKPTLERVVERVRRSEEISQVVVATSDLAKDEPIIDLCDRLGVDWYRGSESDVLSRYLEAAEHFQADPIIRVTADCPLIDPSILDALVRMHRKNGGAFTANNLPPLTFPHGLDAEVFTLEMLRSAAQQTGEDYDYEHVTQWMRKQPGLARLSLGDHEGTTVDLHDVRITLDTRDDLTVIRNIYVALRQKEFITTQDVLWLIERRPELARLATA